MPRRRFPAPEAIDDPVKNLDNNDIPDYTKITLVLTWIGNGFNCDRCIKMFCVWTKYRV